MLVTVGWLLDIAILCVVFGVFLLKSPQKAPLGKLLFTIGLTILAVSGILYGLLLGLRGR